MAAKITGNFILNGNSFRFSAIAYGRIGGQNVGVKLSKKTESDLKNLDYDIDEVINTLQKNLLQGNLNLPEGLKKESFVDSENSASARAFSQLHPLV